jgi:hypothetical protein
MFHVKNIPLDYLTILNAPQHATIYKSMQTLEYEWVDFIQGKHDEIESYMLKNLIHPRQNYFINNRRNCGYIECWATPIKII